MDQQSVSQNSQVVDYTQFPDERGHFGIHGGRFVSETLMAALEDLEKLAKKQFEAQKKHEASILLNFVFVVGLKFKSERNSKLNYELVFDYNSIKYTFICLDFYLRE